MTVSLRRIQAKETASLRHKILRPHQTIEEMAYPNDEISGAIHIGAFLNDQIVGIVSIYPETQTGKTDQRQQWRLRGMATDEIVRGQGVGKLLLRQALKEAQNQGGKELWCNARTSACGFYTKLGFQIQGDEFEISGIGPHYIMSISLSH